MLKLADDPRETKVQLRDGRAAGIYEVDGDFIYGWYIGHDGEKYGARWHLNGRWYTVGECNHDLVNSPEPPVTVERWAVLGTRDEVSMWLDHPCAETIKAYGIKGIRKHTITVTPGEGLEQA